MATATSSAAIAVAILIAANRLLLSDIARLGEINHAGQIQLVHSLASIASATFMNVGGVAARRAPASFLLGALAYCLPIYADMPTAGFLQRTVTIVGVFALASGWATLIYSARTIDRP
jgi:uncharacterized membrane protein YgdD (TMEM256/DUF423 family)